MITSRDNQFVRQVKRLLSDSGARRAEGLFAIEGARLCEDAALSGVKIRTLLYTPEAQVVYASRISVLKEYCDEYYEISASLSKRIGDTLTPQGVFCVCELLDNLSGLDKIEDIKNAGLGFLALENLQDPANMGAIIRTAEALGMDGILLSDGCCDVYNPKVLRGSMGGVFRLPLINVGEMSAAVGRLASEGIACFACVIDKDAVPLPEAGFSRGSVCVIGNEGSGLKSQTVSACTGKITIPMGGRAESLNAAMAAGIVMWEMARAVSNPAVR